LSVHVPSLIPADWFVSHATTQNKCSELPPTESIDTWTNGHPWSWIFSPF